MPADPHQGEDSRPSPAERFGRKEYGLPRPDQAEPGDDEAPQELPCFSQLRGQRFAFAFDLCAGPDVVLAIPYADLRPFTLLNRAELRLRFPGGSATITGRNLEPLHVALRDHKLVRVRTLAEAAEVFRPDDACVVFNIAVEWEEEEQTTRGAQPQAAAVG